MKRRNPAAVYRIEELVVRAYALARQATTDRRLAAMIVSKILEDHLRKSGRIDLLMQLQSPLL